MRLIISLRLLFMLALLWAVPCHAQLTTMGAGSTKGAAPPSFSLTFESSNSSTATTATIDYGTLTYGSGNTRVIVAIAWRASTASTVSGVTIGGTALTQISGAAANVSTTDFVDMWISSAPLSGSSGDVQVTYTGTVTGSSNGVALYNLVTTTPAPSAHNSGTQSFGPTVSTTLTVPSGGAAVVVANAENSSITSATNFTIDFNHSGGAGQEVAGHTTTIGSVTPTANSSGSDVMVISAVAWGP